MDTAPLSDTTDPVRQRALPTQDWAAFLVERGQRRVRAVAAADALLGGDRGPAQAMLAGWRLSQWPAATRALLDQVVATPARPRARHAAALLAPDDGLACPPYRGAAAGHLLQRWLFDETSQGLPLDQPLDGIAWALAALDWTGRQVELRERQAWRDRSFRPVADRDAATQVIWRKLLAGDPWSTRESFEKLFLPVARRSFRAALASHRVPRAERRPYLRDLEDTLFWYMIGGPDGAPGWRELAVRLVEHAPPGPVDAIARGLNPTGRQWVTGCPGGRADSWQQTAARLWPDLPGLHAWRPALEDELAASPDRLEALLDAKVALRLVQRWSQDDAARTHPDDDWHLVLRHRSRDRGRLRAVLLETSPDALLDAVADPAGLYARTATAVAIYAWCRACGVLERRQLPGWEDRLTPACAGPVDQPVVADQQDPLLRTWLVLVALRGRWQQLEHWARTGRWLQRPDATFGRLLKDQLPAGLADDGGGYAGLQAGLALGLATHRQGVRAVLDLLVEADDQGRFKDALTGLGPEHWDPAVPLPQRLQAGFADNLRTTLRLLDQQQAAAGDPKVGVDDDEDTAVHTGLDDTAVGPSDDDTADDDTADDDTAVTR